MTDDKRRSCLYGSPDGTLFRSVYGSVTVSSIHRIKKVRYNFLVSSETGQFLFVCDLGLYVVSRSRVRMFVNRGSCH